MAFPDGYVLHDRFWYAADGSGPWFIDADGTALPIAVPCTDITEANLALVAASATNIGKEYWVTDRRGGCRVKSNGTTWVEVGVALSDSNGPASSTWAARSTGAAAGDIKRITDLGNNPLVEAQWDAVNSLWRPRGGRQPIYQLTAAVTNTQVNPSLTCPNVTIPGGLMNSRDGFLVEAAMDFGIAPSAVSEALTLGGSTLRNNTNTGTSRRRWFTQRVLNDFATGAQFSLEKNSGGEYGAPGVATSVFNTLTKDTTGDLVIAGTMSCTSASATAKLYVYNVWWIRG